MMLYISISSPPSRYLFEEPSFALVLSRFVARCEHLSRLSLSIIADHSLLAYVVAIVTSRLSAPRSRQRVPGGNAHRTHVTATRFLLPKKRKSLHFSEPLPPGRLRRMVGEQIGGST